MHGQTLIERVPRCLSDIGLQLQIHAEREDDQTGDGEQQTSAALEQNGRRFRHKNT